MKRHQLPHNQPSLQLGHTREGMPFTLTGSDFARHKHIMGISGSGKSYFLASLALLLFSQGIAFCLIDPHGDLAKLILTLLAGSDYFTDRRAYDRLWYVDFKRAEKDAAIPFNVLNQPYEAHTIANNVLEATHRAFPVSGTTTSLDNVMLAASLVLIENNQPITELPRLILDRQYRETLLQSVSDPLVVQFFKSKFGEKVNSQLVDSTLRRSFLLTFSPVLRHTLGQAENTLNFRKLMDERVSCIFNLGGLDDQTKRFLGCLLMVGLEQAFLSRADLEPEKRHPTHVFCDEFQLFMNNSEISFSRFLEECRKYSGVMYCAHQHLQQLPSGISGALQNALSIVMQAGYEDSSKLVQNFYRQPQEKSRGFFDSLLELFGFKEKHPQSVFTEMENKEQGRYLFETLNRQEALVTLNGITTLIKTNTIPSVHVDPSKLKEIEDTYAQQLFTPLSRIGNDTPASIDTVGLSPGAGKPIAKRRVAAPSPHTKEPYQTCVGAAGTEEELRQLFSQYHYLTVSQVARILQKSENTARNKLTKLVKAGVLETQNVPRTTPSGKTPLVYTLVKKGQRKHEFLEHTLAVNEVLLNSALLPTVASDFTVLDLQHERNIKNAPLKISEGIFLIPDGYVQFVYQGKEQIGICFEIDRNTENKEKIQDKIRNYLAFASGIYQQAFACQSLTIAFVVTEGGDLRVKTLKNWAHEILQDKQEHAALFLFAAVNLDTLTPNELFFSPSWSSISAPSRTSLIEI